MAEGDVSVEGQPWRRTLARFAVAVVVLAALTVGGVVLNVGGIGDSFNRISRDFGMPWSEKAIAETPKDADGDGLSDDVETEGWQTLVDGVVFTDPRKSDSDGDGLTDGQEAGPSVGDQGTAVYATLSNPLESDTDTDKVADGDEYFLDMNPRLRDSDRDGLLDNLELDFGSDPTIDNPDDDRYPDKEEFDRGSDPMAYDLRRSEAIAAFLVGATAGDWKWGARNLGRLGDAQLESPEYLAGQIASGFVGIGDLRDIAANVGTLDFLGAVVSVVGVAPLAGDATKTIATLTKFAKSGDRAERAAAAVVENLPWSQSAKKNALRKMFGKTVRLPTSLRGGPKNTIVYRGQGYVGITTNFDRRKSQHSTAGRTFMPEEIAGASKLSRGEARAIEETCIVQGGLAAEGGSLQNQRHSINPNAAYYDDAIIWGKAFLKKVGSTCT